MAGPKRPRGRSPRRLHPRGVSDDGTQLLLGPSSSASPTYRVPIDGDLVDALEAAHAQRARVRAAQELADLPPPVETAASALSVREIQDLLRQGRPIAAIAKKAGVSEDWVRRWEGPIVWERSGAATRARRATLRRPRGGASKLPLGESVAVNLVARGIKIAPEEFDSAWDSVKRARGGRWIVSFTFDSRKRQRVARWEFDLETEQVKALDDLAASLGWVARRGS